MPSIVRNAFGWLLFGMVALVGCELGARLDDWLFDDVPLWTNPSFEGLLSRDEHYLPRGRPGARWKKVRINNLGMRGIDVPEQPVPGCRRIMFLGASETFGEPAVADAEYPERVRREAAPSGCIQVLNTSFPGIAPQSLNDYYVTYLARYRPQVVYVYPSTHFYLAENLPRKPRTARTGKPKPAAAQPSPSLLERSRFIERLKDSAEVPAPIQRLRTQRRINEESQNEPTDWMFTGIPPERLDLLSADLTELLQSIRDSGAEPIVMTHAVRVTAPPRAADITDLQEMRVYVPRATPTILAAFEYAGQVRVREVAAAMNVRLVDVAKALNGRRELFEDLVHFNPQGHEEVARLIVAQMSGAPPT